MRRTSFRPVFLVPFAIALLAPSPAWADVVTFTGHDSCPGGGSLIFGPGFAATVVGSDGSSEQLLCMEPNYGTHPGSGQAQLRGWTEICFADAVNCSGSAQVLACVVCQYPDASVAMVAPALSVGGLVFLISAIVGTLFCLARRSDQGAGLRGASS